MMTHANAVSSSVWSPLRMSYPESFLSGIKERFVRSTAETSTVEPRTADAGVLFVGVFGVQNLKTFGDLFISYDIEFSLPQLVRPAENVGTQLVTYGTASSYHPQYPLRI